MGEGFGGQLPFLLMILVVFVFFIILPAQRRQKKEKTFVKNLKKGDRIVTKSGLYGRILETSDTDNSCVIETMAGKLKYDRSAISAEMSQKLNASPSDKKKK